MARTDKPDDGLLSEPPPAVEPEQEVARLRSELVRIMAWVCPAWLADRSDDFVQVALLRVLKARKRSEGKAEPSPFYLKKAAYSVVVDHIRSRRQEVSLEEIVEAQATAEGPDPEQNAVGREIGRAVRDCLGAMAPSRRRAVTLYLQGYRIPEAAQLLKRNEKSVENSIYRGLANLQRCLERRGIH